MISMVTTDKWEIRNKDRNEIFLLSQIEGAFYSQSKVFDMTMILRLRPSMKIASGGEVVMYNGEEDQQTRPKQWK